MKVLLLALAHADLLALRSYIVKNFSDVVWQITYSKLKTFIKNWLLFRIWVKFRPNLRV